MKEKLTRAFKWVLRNLLLATGTLLIVLILLEIAYRFSWFEFYGTEITALNASTSNKKVKSTVLVFGDSFTACENNYVSILNDSLPNIRFVNAGIPGVGMDELYAIAERRINKFNPDKILLQLYVGNDLIDEEKPVNWHTISFGRNCYWSIANHFYCIRYVNYKLGQFKSGTELAVESKQTKTDGKFSSTLFSAREKMLTVADADYLDQSINLTGEYARKYSLMKDKLEAFVNLCSENNIPLYVVIIPASCQLGIEYRNNLTAIGADFNKPFNADTTYPFFDRIVKDFGSQVTDVLNPLGTFRKAEDADVPMYYCNDIHLNAEGQKQLAQFLLPVFTEPNK